MIQQHNLLKELDREQSYSVLFNDSQSAIHLAKNLMFHARMKHIQLRNHFIGVLLEDGSLSLEKIQSLKNPIDILNKIVTIEKLRLCTILICLLSQLKRRLHRILTYNLKVYFFYSGGCTFKNLSLQVEELLGVEPNTPNLDIIGIQNGAKMRLKRPYNKIQEENGPLVAGWPSPTSIADHTHSPPEVLTWSMIFLSQSIMAHEGRH